MKIKNILLTLFVLSAYLFGQNIPDPVKFSSGQKYNARGIFDNESIRINGKEIISDYDGNLMMEYSTKLNYPDNLSGNFTIIYNANVVHKVFVPEWLSYGAKFAPHHSGYSVNAPEWILGYKGIALQTLNFETNLFKPNNNISNSEEYVGNNIPNNVSFEMRSEVPLLIPGYHFTNKLSSRTQDSQNSPCLISYNDRIYILKSDGSTIELKNVKENTKVGLYLEKGSNNYGYAIVEELNPSSTTYLARKMWYRPGDGLTYYFEEEFIKYGNCDAPKTTDLRTPTIMYLKEISSPGNKLNFHYAHLPGNGLGYGRKFFQTITFSANRKVLVPPTNTNKEDFWVQYGYSSTVGKMYSIALSNKNKNSFYKLELNGSSSYIADKLFSNKFYFNKTRRYDVIRITDEINRTNNITYSNNPRAYYYYNDHSIKYDFYLPQEIAYFTKKKSKFEYYNAFFGESDLVSLDGYYQTSYKNMTRAKRDCFTNFMLKKRETYNAKGSLRKVESYDYDSDRSVWDENSHKIPKLYDIITKITISDQNSPDTEGIQITKNFNKYNVAQINEDTFDKGSQVKLKTEEIKSLKNNKVIKKTYSYDENLSPISGCGYNFYKNGNFLIGNIKEEKKDGDKLLTKETKYDYIKENINYKWYNKTVGTKEIIKVKKITDPQSLVNTSTYLNIFPTASLENKSHLEGELYMNIGLLENEKTYSGTLTKSNTKNLYYLTGNEKGKISKKINNPDNRETSVNYSYKTAQGFNSFLGNMVYDKGVTVSFNYPDNTYNSSVKGKVVKLDLTEKSKTMYHNGYQPNPFHKNVKFQKLNNDIIELNEYTAYNNKNKIEFSVDNNGYYSDYTYDDLGRIKTVNLQGSFTSNVTPFTSGYSGNSYSKKSLDYIYDDSNNILKISKKYLSDNNDNRKIEELYTYDAFGNNITQKIKNSSGSFYNKDTSTYDYRNLLSTSKTGTGVKTSYSYNFLNQLTESEVVGTNTGSKKVKYIWQSGTVPGSSPAKGFFEYTIHEDEEGRTIYTYYDKVGNKVAEKVGNNNPTIFNYNGIYQLTSVISPERKRTTYKYDGLGYLSEKTTPDDGTYKYKYDKWGNLRFTRHQESGNEVIFNTYDPLNRLVTKGKFEKSSYAFHHLNPDVLSNDEKTTNNALTVNMYDTYTRSGVFSPLPNKTIAEIESMNLKGRLAATAFRDEKTGTWSYKIYSYDHLGRVNKYMVKMTNQAWKTIESKYDHIGNLVWQSINNEHFVWNYYDAEGRLAKVKSNKTNSESSAKLEAQYSYNNADQIVKVGTHSSVTNLNDLTIMDTQYKTDVEIVAKNVHVLGASGAELNLTAGNSITLKPGFKVSQGGKFTAKIDPTLADTNNKLAYGTIDYQYNNRGWVSKINSKNKSGTTLFNESLTYEKNGNIKTQGITNKANSSWANLNFTYGYDPMNRLTSSNCGNSSYNETFAYDGDGNFTRKVSNGKTYNYNYFAGTNKLNTIPGYFSYLYDYKGNVTTKKNNSGTTLFTASKYDHRNLPLQVWDRSSGTTYYSYDDSGNRIHKKVGNGSVTNEYYLRDHTGKEVALYNVNNNKLNQVNLFGNGMIGNVKTNWSGSTRTDERYYYVNDHLGTPRLVLDGHSNISSGKDYYAFGKTLREINNGTEQKYDYTSKELDKETGLHYFGARYYDSEGSFWYSVDPLADLNPGQSPYNYAGNNPLNNIDPNGMDWYSQTDSNGTVTYHWNKDLTKDNAGDLLTDGQAWVGVNQFVDGLNGYEFLGATESDRFGAWKDRFGFSYYNDNYGMTNMYVTGEMALDIAKTSLFISIGQGKNLVKRQASTMTFNLFRPGSYLNSGKYLRIGFGRHEGKWVFRAGGKFIEKLGFSKGKIDFFKIGPKSKSLKDLLGL